MDFKVGDVVVCVDDRTSAGSPVCGVRRGRHYRVDGVIHKIGFHDLFGVDGGGLVLRGVSAHGRDGYAAARFRHLPKASDEFTAQMRNLRPVKDKVNG